ncbi:MULTISPECIES: pyridoxal phosphate-dependent aminotransferase [Pelosinus]|uniref:Aminotransferase class I and II n=1 Tax=Pelosinus fermentans B4 TaxID=1149862 RepID=I9LAR7_9FIRM|nr:MULTISPECIES: pyridoxal phosphate-dependent aminotransferase [Pelosinus]MDF2572686.1 Kynurenine--oxoglutarate transaminase [Sporomusa sp.]EIW17391.1 aminotransferase class I and II [Pelosinus fermentans B4]EIW23450.1 aminotransferase class I and II [Pelosinus fermentans A11]OAM96548.1 Aspartate transaminase [Pelosinus fermentans DSM 17108]SDR41245.1 Aminotransferase class I and II [Pelosinus fermentans]
MAINRFDVEGKLSVRITQITVPSFKQLADLAVQHQAIDLGGGKPDFPANAEFKDAAIQAIQDDLNQYAPSQGITELRQGISKRLQQKTQVNFDAELEITICSGVTESMAAALLAVIDPGDEVIVLVPAFAAYAADVQLCGGKPVYVELTQPDFRLEKEKVEAVITERTKAIIFNSPMASQKSTVLQAGGWAMSLQRRL